MRINQNDTHFTRSVGTHCDIYAEAAIYGYEPEDVDSGEYTVPFTNRDSYHEKVRKESGLSVQKYNAIQALVNRRMIEKDWSF